jgi:hypothetical protein
MLSPSRVISAKLDAQASARPANAARGRKNYARGEVAQNAIEWRLRALGLLMVERIHTPWKIQRHPVTRKIVNAIQMEKVSGDFRALLPGGRSVLVEVKGCDALVFSAFARHQVDALNGHHAAGGLSLIGWQWPGGDSVMVWPVPNFHRGTSLPIETAKSLNVTRIR